MGVEAVNREAGKRRKADRTLLQLFGQLAPGQQDKLIAFAEFLAAPASAAPRAGGGESVSMPRPARETVMMAIRRLVRSYPALDRRKLMTEASQLMTQHALEGRAAGEVIDHLETVFARHYEARQKSQGTRHK